MYSLSAHILDRSQRRFELAGERSIERLFETEPDAKEVIKKREIYQVMEIVTDKCEDAGNVIESIIIKYA